MHSQHIDLISDDFISYHDDFIVKQEKISDPDLTLNPTSFSLIPDPSLFYPPFISPKLRNILESNDLTVKEPLSLPENPSLKRRKPFKIIKSKREESADSIKVKVEPDKKVITNSRREYRREVAKKKSQRKLEAKNLLCPSDNMSLASENFSNSALDGKTGKKMLQMIRNRISAQNSRDRRKAYLNNLEQTKDILFSENMNLNLEKAKLLEEMNRLKESNELLMKERAQLLNQEGSEEVLQKDMMGSFSMANIGSYLSKLGAMNLLPNYKNKVNMALSLGIMVSLVIMMRLNHQQNTLKLDVYDDQEQSTLAITCNKMKEDILEDCFGSLRKGSQSTTISSHESPLIGKHLNSPHHDKMNCYNDGTDDGWLTNCEHMDGGTPPFEEHREEFSCGLKIQQEFTVNKGFDVNEDNELMFGLQRTLNQLKEMRGPKNQLGHMVDLSLSNNKLH